MKNIPEERLSTIGKLIEVTREEKRNKSQNKYTMKSFVEGICTVNTLKRIEAGEIARIEDVYVELLDKLNLKLGYFPAVDDAILELMDPLYEAIEYYKVEDISKYCDMGLRVLGKVKNYVYYSELYDLLLATKEYFEEAKIISLSKMERFRNEYKLFNEKYHSLFKIMVFYRAKRETYGNPKLFEDVVKELGFLETENITEAILSLNYCIIFDKHITFKQRAKNLEQILKDKNNDVRLLDIYFYILYVLIKIEYKSCEEYLSKAEKLIKNGNIPKIKIMDFYSNIAGSLHENQLYEKALCYYKKMIKISKASEILLPSLNCMAHCQRILGLKVDIPRLNEEDLKHFSKLDQLIYNYFINQNVKSFVKINFILKEIAPNLIDKGMVLIFRDEMRLLVKETNSYKNLYLYDEIVKNILNDDFL